MAAPGYAAPGYNKGMIIDSFEIAGWKVVVDGSLRPIMARLKALGDRIPKLCADIGASDGLTCNNTLMLYLEGWRGLSLEAAPGHFAHLREFYRQHLPWVRLGCERVTPANVSGLLARAELPRDFGFLSLDIDSFDYDVLAALLAAYRPGLICAEINEKIPPPIHFHIPYREDHRYQGDHFYGMSLRALYDLAQAHDYLLLELCFNNALLMPRELSPWPGLTPAAAYAAGYLAGSMPAYNQDMELLHSLGPEAGLEFLNQKFAAYAGRYVCKL